MRSPSPTNAMDVDPQSFSKYDEYIRGNPPEVITVETRIKSSNKGYELLQKQGWSEGQPLGLSGDGAFILNSTEMLLNGPCRSCGSYPVPSQTRFDGSGKDQPRCTDDRNDRLSTT
jgi:hypothetical protein